MNCLSCSNWNFVRFCLFVCLKGGTVEYGFQRKKGLNLHLNNHTNIKFVNLEHICGQNRSQRVQKQNENIWWKLVGNDPLGSFLSAAANQP